MSRISDLGGMQNMGELGYSASERMFHEDWEGRVQSLAMATAVYRRGPLREWTETIPAQDYLQMSYYERLFVGVTSWLTQAGLITNREVASGKSAGVSKMAERKMSPEFAGKIMFRPFKTKMDVPAPSKFKLGEQVRVRNDHAKGHTRRPRYTKGKVGMIERDNGVFGFPDSLTQGTGPKPQHLYLVSFAASELWGDDTPSKDKLYVSMWEDYLEPTD